MLRLQTWWPCSSDWSLRGAQPGRKTTSGAQLLLAAPHRENQKRANSRDRGASTEAAPRVPSPAGGNTQRGFHRVSDVLRTTLGNITVPAVVILRTVNIWKRWISTKQENKPSREALFENLPPRDYTDHEEEFKSSDVILSSPAELPRMPRPLLTKKHVFLQTFSR